MSEEFLDFSVIEKIKENIQPLKSGRNIAQLIQAIQEQEQAGDQEELYTKKHAAFQADIQNYSGTDKLIPWLVYVGWIQQTYYSSNRAKFLVPTLEKCLQEFQSLPEFHQDERLLKLYIQYCDNIKDPEYVFAFLMTNNICTNTAMYYKAYSMVLYAKKKYSLASEMIKRGLERQAQPLKMLKDEEAKYKKLELKRSSMNEVEEAVVEPSVDARQVLVSSKVIFRDQAVSKIVSYDDAGVVRKALTTQEETVDTERKAFNTKGLGYNTMAVSAKRTTGFKILEDGEEEAPGIVVGIPVLPAQIYNDNDATRALSSQPDTDKHTAVMVSPNKNKMKWDKLPSQDALQKENRMPSMQNIARDAKISAGREHRTEPAMAKPTAQATGRPGGMAGGMMMRPSSMAGGLKPGRALTTGTSVSTGPPKPAAPTSTQDIASRFLSTPSSSSTAFFYEE